MFIGSLVAGKYKHIARAYLLNTIAIVLFVVFRSNVCSFTKIALILSLILMIAAHVLAHKHLNDSRKKHNMVSLVVAQVCNIFVCLLLGVILVLCIKDPDFILSPLSGRMSGDKSTGQTFLANLPLVIALTFGALGILFARLYIVFTPNDRVRKFWMWFFAATLSACLILLSLPVLSRNSAPNLVTQICKKTYTIKPQIFSLVVCIVFVLFSLLMVQLIYKKLKPCTTELRGSDDPSDAFALDYVYKCCACLWVIVLLLCFVLLKTPVVLSTVA